MELRETLGILRANGVKSAHFDCDGDLDGVEFFPAAAPMKAAPVDDPETAALKVLVDLAGHQAQGSIG